MISIEFQFQGEDLQVKMKNLASEMQSKSSILSLALSLSTIVILLGIFGLVVVANHRQRKREQLKAILRAKNLGPVLESRKIASEVGSNFLPKYTQFRPKSTASSIAAAAASSPPKQPRSFKPKFPAALTSPRSKTAAELAAIDGKFQSRLKKLDFNEFLSGLLYRVRKGEFTPEHSAVAPAPPDKEFSPPPPPPLPPVKYTTPELPPPPPPKKPPPTQQPQTSFFYKEGSLTKSESSSASSSASSSSAASSCGDVIRETVEVEVNKRRSPKSSAKGARPPSSAISSVTSTSSSSGSSSSSRSSYSSPGSARKFRRQQESRSGIYSSKISQQVFVHEPSKASKRDSAATSRGSTIKTAKSTHSSVLKQQNKQQVAPPEDFQGELKDKCMTFFSSVTRTKADVVSDKTKL